MYKKFLLVGSGNFVNEIKPRLSGLALEIEVANTIQEVRSKLKNRSIDLILFDDDSCPLNSAASALIHKSNTNFVVFSIKKNIANILTSKNIGASDYIIKPYNTRELNLRLSAILNSKFRISCIGGGTGLFNILLGLKDIPGTLLNSIVSMTDDGGSSGRLRETFGVLPPGDVRRSLVALSNAPQVMNEMMTFRFDRGGCFKGHSFGNLLLTVLNEITGSMADGVANLGDILNIGGIVRPISITESRLCALFENGKIIKGESNIDLCKGRSPELRIKKCWHEPESKGDINAYSAIINSDFVTIGPGDLYTSVITNLLIKDIRGAIVKTKAKKIYICNLMTKPGETANYDAYDHVKDIIKYLKEDRLDYIILSDNNSLSMDAVRVYAKKKQYPVKTGSLKKIREITKAKIIIADVAHETELIRHDSEKIATEITRIIKKEK